MRRIVGALRDYRLEQLNQAGRLDNKRTVQVRELFNVVDNGLSGLTLTEGGGFDGPESKLAEVMTSADFTYAIQGFVQRQLTPGYERKRFEFEPLVKPETLPNFLPVTRLQNRAGVDDLEYVAEKGEARPGSVDDAYYRQFRVYKWEKQFDFSMETLVNDDLGYLTDQARLMGEAARRTLEKFVSRFYTNATTIARLQALGANYHQHGRLTSTRISEARMAFSQRLDARNEPVNASLRYLVHHTGLIDAIRVIRQSQLIPELATNAANVIAGDFVPIEDPYIAGAAPALPWYCFSDYNANNIVPFILARRAGVPSPRLWRKKSDIESFGSFSAAGADDSPIWGDFATGDIVVKVHDEWGTYIDGTDGNMYDTRGSYYSDATVA